MKNKFIFALLFFTLQLQAKAWKLVWSDEFSYTGLPDSTRWRHETGNIKNNELERYTFRRFENSKVENGNLLIIAKKENYQGASYTSSRLSTDSLFNFTYGKIEARIKAPKGKGIWPAFWLLGQNINKVGSPQCGEIDIMEHVNNENFIHSAMHWDKNGLISFEGTKECDIQKFHIYTVEWNKNKIKWYLDGKKYLEGKINKKKQNADEFRKPFYIILNIAVGGNWPGKPDDTTLFPAIMSVDYIRIYKK